HGFKDMLQEPAIDGCDLMYLLNRPTLLKSEANIREAIRRGRDELLRNERRVENVRGRRLADLEAAYSLGQRLFERSADRHHFADRLHLGTQHRLRSGEFLKLPARDLDNHIVESRLK